jgi:hypothetical protein
LKEKAKLMELYKNCKERKVRDSGMGQEADRITLLFRISWNLNPMKITTKEMSTCYLKKIKLIH